jgi:hypothetical protein
MFVRSDLDDTVLSSLCVPPSSRLCDEFLFPTENRSLSWNGLLSKAPVLPGSSIRRRLVKKTQRRRDAGTQSMTSPLSQESVAVTCCSIPVLIAAGTPKVREMGSNTDLQRNRTGTCSRLTSCGSFQNRAVLVYALPVALLPAHLATVSSQSGTV